LDLSCQPKAKRHDPHPEVVPGKTELWGLGRQFFWTMQEVTDNEEDARDDERQANYDESVEGHPHGRPDPKALRGHVETTVVSENVI